MEQDTLWNELEDQDLDARILENGLREREVDEIVGAQELFHMVSRGSNRHSTAIKVPAFLDQASGLP